MGSSDRMQVAREVQVYLLHREDLGVTASGSPTLDPKDGSQRWFPDDAACIVPLAVQTLVEADGGDRLSLSEGGRVDAGDENKVPIW